MKNRYALFVKHFLVFFLIFTGLIIWIYSGSGREKMGDFYRVNGNFWLSDFVDGGEVIMKNDRNTKDKYDTIIWLTSKQQKKRVADKARRNGKLQAQYSPIKFPIDSWANSCLFFVFFIALMVAAPVSIKRKLLGLLFGLPLVYVFIYLKMWLCIIFMFSKYYDKFEVGFNSPIMLSILNHIYNMIMYPFFGLTVTLLICLSFTFGFRNKKNEMELESKVGFLAVSKT